MNSRIYVRDLPMSGLVICHQDDEGAVAYDRVSSKETAEGRVNRLVAALNCALILTPDSRLVSYGTRVEVRPSAGHFHDPALDAVAEFQTAFGLTVATEPKVPEFDDQTAEQLYLYYHGICSYGEMLQKLAAQASERGDEGGNLVLLRLQLIHEEFTELIDALHERDIVEVLDALVDLDYVIAGTYLSFGLGHYRIAGFNEVHASNMSKLDENGKPIIAPSGRVMKGENYRRPDLKGVLGL